MPNINKKLKDVSGAGRNGGFQHEPFSKKRFFFVEKLSAQFANSSNATGVVNSVLVHVGLSGIAIGK
jgi:hypothetical protein